MGRHKLDPSMKKKLLRVPLEQYIIDGFGGDDETIKFFVNVAKLNYENDIRFNKKRR